MKETSKAMQRRWLESDAGMFPWKKILSGKGLDVGPGDDPLTCAMAVNLPDGEECDITQILHPCLQAKFDFVHASQVLEHMRFPIEAFHSWIKMLKVGGWIVGTVPDFKLYEHKTWPSRWNKAHQTSWSMAAMIEADDVPTRCNHIVLPYWFLNFPEMKLQMCRLVDTNYNYDLKGVDQTAGPLEVEAFIEFSLKKVQVCLSEPHERDSSYSSGHVK